MVVKLCYYSNTNRGLIEKNGLKKTSNQFQWGERMRNIWKLNSSSEDILSFQSV